MTEAFRNLAPFLNGRDMRLNFWTNNLSMTKYFCVTQWTATTLIIFLVSEFWHSSNLCLPILKPATKKYFHFHGYHHLLSLCKRYNPSFSICPLTPNTSVWVIPEGFSHSWARLITVQLYQAAFVLKKFTKSYEYSFVL